MEIESQRGQDPQPVLHDEIGEADHAEDHQAGSAPYEHPEIRSQADRREEGEHERALQLHVEAQREVEAEEQDAGEEGEEDPADDGNRDVIVPQEADPRDGEASDEEHDHGRAERLGRVEIQPHARILSSRGPGGSVGRGPGDRATP